MNTNNAEILESAQVTGRDVSSTARLFHFTRPVFMSERVWHDCIDTTAYQKNKPDELAALQRLRHVLFMAASALHGRKEDLDYKFRVYRIPNVESKNRRKPEAVEMRLIAHRDEYNMPVITIKFPEE